MSKSQKDGAIVINGRRLTTTNLPELVTEASDEKLLLLRTYGNPATVRAAQREIVKRLGRRLRDQRLHSDRLGAVTIPED